MSVLGAIGSAIGGFAASQSSNPISYYYDRKLMGHQHDYAIEDWNLQNAYNTPAAQMARFKEAGLNPNLIYGQTNTASSVGSGPSANFHAPATDLFGMLSQIYGVKEKKATIANLEEQNRNIQSQNKLLGSQSSFIESQKRMQDLKNIYFQNTGRLPREEGAFGASIGDFFRYIDAFSPKFSRQGLPPKGKLLISDKDYLDNRRQKAALEKENRSAIRKSFSRALPAPYSMMFW